MAHDTKGCTYCLDLESEIPLSEVEVFITASFEEVFLFDLDLALEFEFVDYDLLLSALKHPLLDVYTGIALFFVRFGYEYRNWGIGRVDIQNIRIVCPSIISYLSLLTTNKEHTRNEYLSEFITQHFITLRTGILTSSEDSKGNAGILTAAFH